MNNTNRLVHYLSPSVHNIILELGLNQIILAKISYGFDHVFLEYQ